MDIKEINEQIAQLEKQRTELLQHEATVCGIFKSIDVVNETRINIYKALLNGLVQNYPTMPIQVKEAILNYQF